MYHLSLAKLILFTDDTKNMFLLNKDPFELIELLRNNIYKNWTQVKQTVFSGCGSR